MLKRFLSFVVLSILSLSIVSAQTIEMGIGIPATSGNIGLLRQLQGVSSTLTFMKDYRGNPTSLNATYSVGSPTATFTATRSASAPATYVDSNGLVQLVTSSNTPRYQGGYYDATGFHAQTGLMIENTGTNLLQDTDGTASSGGVWTSWQVTNPTGGTPTKTQVAASDITGISSSNSMRVKYTGSVSDVNSNFLVISNYTQGTSVVQGTIITLSFWIKSQTGFSSISGFVPEFNEYNSSSSYLTTGSGSSFLASVTSSWKRITYTYTVQSASCVKVSADINISGINNGSTVDFQVWGFQVEINPYATSFVPTTATSLTRGAEVLTYAISGNRTAASESTIFKFSPESTMNSTRTLTDTDTKRRFFNTCPNVLCSSPNASDSGAVVAFSSTDPQINTSYVAGAILQHSSPYVNVFVNGSSQGTYTSGDWTTPAWGTNFYIGSDLNGSHQLDGVIQSVVFYSTALTSTQVSNITSILNSGGA